LRQAGFASAVLPFCKLSPRISLNFIWETEIPSRADRKIGPFFMVIVKRVVHQSTHKSTAITVAGSSPLFKLGHACL
jgi:hypothetical protein